MRLTFLLVSLVSFLCNVLVYAYGHEEVRSNGPSPHDSASLSFYGDSYVYLSPDLLQTLLSVSSETIVELQFKTARRSGLLLLIDGGVQYCILSLDNGRIKVNFHAGGTSKTEFLSPLQKSNLSDLVWHQLKLHRLNDHFSLSVDGKLTSFRSVWSENSHQPLQFVNGLYIGGPAEYVQPGHTASPLTYFRGCISDLKINQKSIFRAIDTFRNQTINHNVQANCSSLFKAENSQLPLSFLTDRAFARYELNEPRNSISLHFEVRTKVANCVVFYSSGSPYTSHFILLKLINGTFYVILSHSHGFWYGRSNLTVSDDYWHTVGLKLSEKSLFLAVDGAAETLLQNLTGQLVLGSQAYFGGVQEASVLADSGLSPRISVVREDYFRGCLDNIYLDYRQLEFWQMDLSHGIVPDCTFDHELCNGSECDKPQNSGCSDSHQHIDQPNKTDQSQQASNCQTPLPSVTPYQHQMSADASGPGGAAFFSTPPREPTLLTERPIHMNPVDVAEGNTSRIEWRNLYIESQYPRLGLSNRDIQFRLIELPEHGKLTVLTDGVHKSANRFSYQDIMDGNVNYTHDGSETRIDALEFEVDFANLSRRESSSSHLLNNLIELPKKSTTYSLPIYIKPVNDAPRLTLMPTRTLKLAQNSRIQVTQEHILIVDPDTVPSQVIIKIVFATPASGYFEHRDTPGIPLTWFSQEDLVNGLIFYRHLGLLNSELTLEVTDGVDRSDAVTLHIQAFQLQLRTVRNTGIRVITGLTEIISPQNLSFTTNAPEQVLELTYIVVRLPKSGFIELLDQKAGKWWATERFTQANVDQHQLRYRHAKEDRPTDDHFKFQLNALNTTFPQAYEFKISFIPVSIKIFQPKNFILNNTQKLVLSRDFLFTWTFPRITHPEEIIYNVTSPPKRGYLFKVLDTSEQNPRHRRLGLSSNFTQADISANVIYYKLHYHNHRVIQDSFHFRVITPSVSSRDNVFPIVFLPDNDNIKLTNRTVLVKEGNLQQISEEHISLETKEHKDFVFTIAIPPVHGDLYLLQRGLTIELGNGSGFTTDDISEEKVFYRHDDTETISDRAYLIAKPRNAPVESMVEIPFWINFKILSINDNEPKRVSYSTGKNGFVFHIVSGEERLVRQRDLHYFDADRDNLPEEVQYVFPPSDLNGGFFAARLPDIPVNVFSQEDINEGELMFRHLGRESLFSIPFTVSDGRHFIQDNFTVNASAAFFREIENAAIRVDVGAMVLVSSLNLSMDTNMDVKSSNCVYKVVTAPKYGSFLLSANNPMAAMAANTSQATTVINEFTQQDIDKKLLHYQHTPQRGISSEAALLDVVVLTAYGGNAERTFKVPVTIFKKDDVSLKLAVNKEVTVSIGGVAVISKENLEVTAQGLLPASILYSVVEPPSRGTLILDEANRKASAEADVIDIRDFHVHKFSQFDINAGNVQYLHGNNGQTRDRIVLNATTASGSQRLNFIKLDINVVKNSISVTTTNFTVKAGKSVLLDESIISAKSTYYENPLFLYTITESPKHGWIENRTNDEQVQVDIEIFTSKDLRSGNIFYTHDAGSSWKDSISLVAGLQGENLESEPARIGIKVQHANLKGPEIVHNEALETWNKKVTVISSKHLEARDIDTPIEDLKYIVTSPDRGYVAFKEESGQPIFTFSQKNINDGQVVFVHTERAPVKGGFSFVITDGLHQIEPTWFIAQATEVSVLLEANNKLIVAPQAQTIILPQQLRASVNKLRPDQIVFRITKPPKLGELLLANATKPIESFTQQDINDGRLSYYQSHAPQQWVSRDAIGFAIIINASQGIDKLLEVEEEHKFKIIISYASIEEDHMKQFIITAPLLVEEGSRIVINATHVNVTPLSTITGSHLQIEVTKLPDHGILQFRGRNVTAGDLRFSQLDVINRLLSYQHFGPDDPATLDRIMLDVYPVAEALSKPSKGIMRLRFQLEITIVPSNNKRFRDPIFRTTWSVVRGYPYTVTNKDLYTDDPDTPPSEISYGIVQTPTNGYFAFATSVDEPIRRFTQQDIDHQLVVFLQDGSLREGKFKFQVSDGKFDPVIKEIIVKADPLTLSLVNLTDVLFYQDEIFVRLNQSHLGATTNGPRAEIVYNVTKVPLYGDIYRDHKENKPTRSFYQDEVDRGRIIYVYMNLESEADKFEFSVSNSLNTIAKKSIVLRTIPQVSQHRPAVVSPGKTLTLTWDMLDATKLAESTNDDPVFDIKQPPMFGHLVKLSLYDVGIIGYTSDEASAFPQAISSTMKYNSGDGSFELTSGVKIDDAEASDEEDDEEPDRLSDDLKFEIRRKREKRPANNSASFFTFLELRQNRIQYVSTLRGPLQHVLRDTFVYQLRAKGVKPATGEFTVLVQPTLIPLLEVETSTALPEYKPPASTAAIAPIDMITDYTIGICIVGAVFLLGCMIIVVCKVRATQRRKRDKDQNVSSEIQKTLRDHILDANGDSSSKTDILSSSIYSGLSPSTTASQFPIMKPSTSTLQKFPTSDRGITNSGASFHTLGSQYRTPMPGLQIGSLTSSPARTATLRRGLPPMGDSAYGAKLAGHYLQPAPLATAHSQAQQRSPSGTTAFPPSHSPHGRPSIAGTSSHEAPLDARVSQSGSSEVPVSGAGMIPGAARLVTFDAGKPEIVSNIPLCRVTPLTPKAGASTCSSSASEDWRYAYHYSSSSDPETTKAAAAGAHPSGASSDVPFSLDRTHGGNGGRRRFSSSRGPTPAKQMKLKDNQYWV